MGQAQDLSPTTKIVAERMDCVDNELKQYMLHAEKRCRKIRCGLIPFSPESEVWIRRRQTYEKLLGSMCGRVVNHGNLMRAARRCGILNPQILVRLKVCNDHCDYYCDHGLPYCPRHLQRRAEIAREDGNEEASRQILNMITREHPGECWRRLRHSMGHQNGRSVQSVQVEQDNGEILEYNTQEEVEDIIWSNVHQKRFYLAEEAPIICQSPLRDEFGYLANTEAARAVLRGTYVPTSEIDTATMELFSSIAEIRSTVPKDYVSSLVTAGDWARHWSRSVREETSSSPSGLHFGHQIASTRSPLLSHTHALQCSILLCHGIHLSRWSRGLSVMIEKLRGCSQISKLRSILLMEADINAINKMVVGTRMLQAVWSFNCMPDKIFSE